MVDRRRAREVDHPGAVALAAAPGGQGNYEALTVAELQAELEARGLPTSGLKAELVQRLLDNDAGV
jgi:hypothetical protein